MGERNKIKMAWFILCFFIFITGVASASIDLIEDRAGISAYVKAKPSINLNDAKSAFATIHQESPTHIIGTVAVNLHSEEQYPHVLVNTDGLIIAYYPNERPTSWIFPWADYKGGIISSTTLSEAVEIVATEVGGYTNGMKYYDFRYPDASEMMLITESVDSGTNYFNVEIPINLPIYAVDWSHYSDTTPGYLPGSSSVYLHNSNHLGEAREFSRIDGGKHSNYSSIYSSLLGEFNSGEHNEIKITVNKGISRLGVVLEYAGEHDSILVEYADTISYVKLQHPTSNGNENTEILKPFDVQSISNKDVEGETKPTDYINAPVQLFVEVMVIYTLYLLFKANTIPKRGFIYGLFILFIGPINFKYLGFGTIGLLHSILGFYILYEAYKNWPKSEPLEKSKPSNEFTIFEGNQELYALDEKNELDVFYPKLFKHPPNLNVTFPEKEDMMGLIERYKIYKNYNAEHPKPPKYSFVNQRSDGFRLRISSFGYYKPIIYWQAKGKLKDD